MDQPDEEGPLYSIEKGPDGWRVVGPNGLAGVYEDEREAQARADHLNAEVAEESENEA